MMKHVVLAALLVSCAAMAAVADTTIVDDNFESYANDAALYAVWAPTGSDEGILTTDDTLFPGIEGQAVDHLGGPVIEYTSPLSPSGSLLPSATQNVVLSGDLYDNAWGNKRMSIGMRNTAVENLLELGYWNTDVAGGFSYRLVIWGSPTPNWAQITNFTQDAIDMWERPDDLDEVVTPGDVGPGWHRYSATISETEVTIELDLFRDGVIDATEVIEVVPTAIGFNSLRMGGPSGSTSAGSSGGDAPPMNGGVAFDNILLQLVDFATVGLPGDFNNSGTVEQADLDLVLLNWGADWPPEISGWVNDQPADGTIDQNDLDGVLLNWGNTAASAAAVPEPTTACLAALLCGLTCLLRRKRD